MDQYLDESRTADLSLLSASGFTAGDVRAVAGVPGVESVMASISQDVMMDYGESTQANIDVYKRQG